MLESLVITLREGIEAALVIGIILAYLNKTGKMDLSRAVYVGLGLAVLASIGLVAGFQSLNIDPENEVMEGAMLGIAGVFVATMVVWMWQTARNIKGEMENRLQSIVGDSHSGYSFGQALGLGALTFAMVTREGIETVLFLAAATFGEFDIFTVVGGTIGIALAILFAILFIRGSLRINLSRFFAVTSIVLLLLAVKLVAGSLHEFAEVGMVPMSKEATAVLSYFVRDTSSTVILMGLLAIPMMLILWDTGKKEDREAFQGLNPAEQRKLRAGRQHDRNW